MTKLLKSLYDNLERLQKMERPPKDEIARTTFQINQEKALMAREQRPPEDFGALREVVRGILQEYLTPAHHTVKSWQSQKKRVK